MVGKKKLIIAGVPSTERMSSMKDQDSDSEEEYPEPPPLPISPPPEDDDEKEGPKGDLRLSRGSG